jgi:serine/threonine-protein kinase
MDTWVAPHGNRGPYHGVIEGLAFGISIGAVLLVRYAPVSHRLKVDLGAVLIVPHALALALMNSWVAQPTTQRPLSGITVLILFVGMLAPVRPRRMLIAGLVAAAMDPVAVWIAHLRGLPVPSPLNTVLMFYPNFVCAFLAVIPAQVLYRLGSKIREARALGAYQLVERLGEGGMGEVWLARHRMLARSSAIKLIRPEMLCDGSPEYVSTALSRFEREAQATASLTSPNTIRLYDFGRTGDGTFYYAMELLDGRDLESLVREFGPLKPARTLHLIRQMCRSLGEAHAVGLIHRDIKPANIYVCRMGLEHDFVKVLDFGLVRHENRSQAATLLTYEAGIVGTPAYMAPEAIVGDGNIDRRADVYAVGCVAYFLLTGQQVFGDDSGMKQLMRHVQDTPTPPSRRARHSIPRAVDDLVMACLQKDPQDRPQSADGLYDMASVCLTRDTWDDTDARRWWETHLPQLAPAGASRSMLAAAPTLAAS